MLPLCRQTIESQITDTMPNATTQPSHGPSWALVTGAGRRLGSIIAGALADDGWAVALHFHRSADAANALAEKIDAAGGLAVTVEADLGREIEVGGLVARAAAGLTDAAAKRAAGHTDNQQWLGLLVNNAAIFEPDGGNGAPDLWQAHMAINLRAPQILAQAFVEQVPAAPMGEHEGLIINILDRSVVSPPGDFTAYTQSKAALWTATRALAATAAPLVRVNAVGPGPTLRHPRQSAGHFAAQAAATPLGRHCAPEEIAAAIQFIVSTRSLTGQMLLLDNGHHLL